jgi:glycosyltransferase involved in cell wall biosynthesis
VAGQLWGELPGKLHPPVDAMAMGVPILLGVDGEARAIVEEAGAGIAFRLEDADGLVAGIRRLMADEAYRRAISRAPLPRRGGIRGTSSRRGCGRRYTTRRRPASSIGDAAELRSARRLLRRRFALESRPVRR